MASKREEAETAPSPDPPETARLSRPGVPSVSLVIAIGVAAAVLFPVLGKSGIWDPYELDTADLARRIAIQSFHAQSLELPNAQSGLPTLTDLGMGELPFTSMALGFRLLGMHDWSGRLPLALWAFAGAIVLYAFLSRTIGRRAGVYGLIALVTMPLYFMQARTMLGDAVTMAAVTMGFCGLAGSMLDDKDGAGASRARFAWLAVGLVGLLAGFLCRGLVIGVALPALGVGLGWLVMRVSAPAGTAPREDRGSAFGAFSLAVGAVALGIGLFVLLRTSPEAPLRRAIGFTLLRKISPDATFDLTLRQLGHALFPWSAFLPFAAGRLFRAPVEASDGAREREIGVRIVLIVGAAVALAAYTFLAPYAGPLPFAAPAILAAIAAIAIADLERGAAPSRALALGVLLLGFVLYRDMVLTPEKALSVFSIERASFPKSFEEPAAKVMRLVLLAFAGLVALTWFEAQPEERSRGPSDWATHGLRAYRSMLRDLAQIWNGNLLFGLIVVEAALVGLGGMVYFGRRLHWAAVDKLGSQFTGYGVNAWWVAPLALALVVPLLVLVRDAFRAGVWTVRLPRATGTMLAALLAGGALAFWYYPALAAQLSPKEVFDSYSKLHHEGEPLGLLGVRSRAAAYYKGGEVETFSDASRAFAWLTERPDQRRWLIVQADDLPKLNSLFRKQKGTNLPVLDGRSSQILLVSSELGGHENDSWIAKVVLDRPPTPTHPLDGQFEDQLDVLGWDVTDPAGKILPSVVPQTKYHLRFYYRVTKPITGAWKAFVHIDGFQRRYNGDHAVLDGKYPMSLWQPGDVIVDDYEFQLEPNFTPGEYTVFFGFFAGETRFKVTRGPQQENRVNGGVIAVR